MDQTPQLNASRVVRILYSALLGGLTVCGAMLYLVRRVLQPPAVGATPVLTVVLTVIAVVPLFIALSVLRPRVPDRRVEQDVELYWRDASSRTSAIVLWATVEGAGLVGAVGYFLTGATAPAVAFALAVAALVLLRPGRLEGDGAA